MRAHVRGNRRLLFLALLGAILVALPVQAQTSFSDCSAPDAEVTADNPTTYDTIEVTDELTVDDVIVTVEVSHTFVGRLIVEVVSPEETTVTLHNQQGFLADGLFVTYTDAGDTNDDPYDCECELLPSDGTMSSFDGEFSDGDWELQVTDAGDGSIDGTLDEWCLDMELADAEPSFLRGDVDANGEVEAILDALELLEWQFGAGEDLVCSDAADVNDDGRLLVLTDVVYLLSWQYLGGDDPPAPGTETCDRDFTDDDYRCETAPTCP